jgi:hypothetical protein
MNTDDHSSDSSADAPSAFDDFVEHDLELEPDDPRDWFSRMPPEVVQAAWERYLQRLDLQTEALIADPQLDIWEDLLSDEHRAIVAAVERSVPQMLQPDHASAADEQHWHSLLRCAAVLALHIEENRAHALAAADILPYVYPSAFADVKEEGDEGWSEQDAAFMAKHSIRPVAALPAKRRAVTWSNTEVLVLTNLFWLIIAVWARYFGL